MEPIGYRALVERYHLHVLPHYRWSYVTQGKRHTIIEKRHEKHIYPKDYALKDPGSPFQQLEFALKHEGLNLEIIQMLFTYLSKEEVTEYVRSKVTGKYQRIVWYLWEKLTGARLDLPDLTKGRNQLLLNPDLYYTAPAIASHRHRIHDNLAGNFSFCPLIRRTERLKEFEEKKLDAVAKRLISRYDQAVIQRAMHYLYSKESMSSYEIERERPSKTRSARFIELLRQAGHYDGVTKEVLIELQNAVVDPRFADRDYRGYQNYIGEELGPYRQRIHYVPPKPEDVAALMEGLLSSLNRLLTSGMPPVVIAAVISFGFIYIHPFEDGNGRIHRFLIHHILATQNFTPDGLIFPVSAVILRNLKEYDGVLESVSGPLLSLVDYSLNGNGEMDVEGETIQHYWAIDYTWHAEFLFDCVEKTIEDDYKEELEFLVHYDQMKSDIKEVIDMPDRKIDLFIKLCLQNRGTLSTKKRASEFAALTDEEVSELEEMIKRHLPSQPGG